MKQTRNTCPQISVLPTAPMRHSTSYLHQQYTLDKTKKSKISNDSIVEEPVKNIDQKHTRHRSLTKIFHCCRSCSSLPPCVRGLLLGSFVAGLILTITTVIWLASLNKNPSASAEPIILTTRTTATTVTTTVTTATTETTTSTTSLTTSSTTTSATTSSTSSTTSLTSTTTTTLHTGWNQSAETIAGTGSAGVSASKFNGPIAIALDSSKTLYVADRLNNRVQKWLDGASNGTTVAGSSSGTAGSTLNYLDTPLDIELDANGNIYVAEIDNNRVVLWMVGASSGTVAAGAGGSGTGNNQLNKPYGIVHDWTTGTLYVADTYNHRIMSYASGASSGTKCIGGLGLGTTQLNLPMCLYFDSSSNSLYITNNGANNIVRWVVGASNWILDAGSSSGTAGLSSTLLDYPRDITLDSMKNVYVVDSDNNRIVFFPAGQSTGITIIGSPTGASGSSATLLNSPISLVVDSEFNVYVADYYNQRIQRFDHY